MFRDQLQCSRWRPTVKRFLLLRPSECAGASSDSLYERKANTNRSCGFCAEVTLRNEATKPEQDNSLDCGVSCCFVFEIRGEFGLVVVSSRPTSWSLSLIGMCSSRFRFRYPGPVFHTQQTATLSISICCNHRDGWSNFSQRCIILYTGRGSPATKMHPRSLHNYCTITKRNTQRTNQRV